MFRGEKTAIYWLGLVVLGYSIYQFCLAATSIVAFSFVSQQYGGDVLLSLVAVVPTLAGGIIFLIIGLYIMKAGVKKEALPTQK